MLLVGVGAVWAGYTLVYFGWESLRGPGVGLLDLVVPGRFKGHAASSSKSSAPAAVSGKSSGLGAAGSAAGGAGGGSGGSW